MGSQALAPRNDRSIRWVRISLFVAKTRYRERVALKQINTQQRRRNPTEQARLNRIQTRAVVVVVGVGQSSWGRTNYDFQKVVESAHLGSAIANTTTDPFEIKLQRRCRTKHAGELRCTKTLRREHKTSDASATHSQPCCRRFPSLQREFHT